MSAPLPPPPAALAPAVKGLLARADQWESALGARPELARLVYYSRFAAASASARLACQFGSGAISPGAHPFI